MFKGVLIKKDVLRLFILASFAGIIGVWGIINTAMISRDGVFWVENARALEASESISGCFRAAMSEIENPGLPLMIFGWYRLLSRLGLGRSNLDWVLAGQTLVLLCRILSLVPLYYLGKLLVGRRHAFWAILILIFLPWPAEWGHDVLREWPHLLFLSGGLLMVLLAFHYRRVVFFLPVGLLAGFGHVSRPECAQVIIYALFGLIFVLIRPRELMTRKKAMWGTLLLMLGFAIIFVPYIQMRGEILPLKLRQLLTTGNTAASSIATISAHNVSEVQHAGFLPASMEGVINLVQHLSENLYYYFFPFMLVGLYVFFKPEKKTFGRWFIVGFIILNILMYTALFHHWGYISRRHLLPLTAITAFFIPLGIETVAGLFSRKKTERGNIIDSKRQGVIFIGLIIVGILVCLPKAIMPLGTAGYRKTAEYLKQNTSHNAIIAVPEKRITFYAERKGVFYRKLPMRKKWDYLVTIEKPTEKEILEKPPSTVKVYSCLLRKPERDSKEIVIYKRK